MRWKIVAMLVCVMFLAPLVHDAVAREEMAKVEIFDCFGNKIEEREISAKKLDSLERDIARGDLDVLGIKHDFGFSNYVISYGRGEVFIPLYKERSFLRLMLRPIFFNYFDGGFTIVKFGANYVWKGSTIGDYGIMFRDQCGMLLGFIGLHIQISWKLHPETHIFVGGTLLAAGYDRFL